MSEKEDMDTSQQNWVTPKSKKDRGKIRRRDDLTPEEVQILQSAKAQKKTELTQEEIEILESAKAQKKNENIRNNTKMNTNSKKTSMNNDEKKHEDTQNAQKQTKNISKEEMLAKKKEQEIRNLKRKITSNLMGVGEKCQNHDDIYIINVSNLEGTEANIEKCKPTMIANVLSNLFAANDIKNVQTNKLKKWATCKIYANSTKTKAIIETLKNEDIPYEMANQIKWKLSLYKKRSSIGVIKSIPKGEEAKDIKQYLEDRNLKVENVRKIGETVFSIKFLGPLPEIVQLPYYDYPIMVEKYIPRPMRCMNCLEYGHKTNTCTKPKKCMKCGGEGHSAEECNSQIEPKCPNCDEQHGPGDKTCLVRLDIKNKHKHKIENQRIERENIAAQAFHSIWDFPKLPTTKAREEIVKEKDDNLDLENLEERILKNVNETIDDKFKIIENNIAKSFQSIATEITKNISNHLENLMARYNIGVIPEQQAIKPPLFSSYYTSQSQQSNATSRDALPETTSQREEEMFNRILEKINNRLDN